MEPYYYMIIIIGNKERHFYK